MGRFFQIIILVGMISFFVLLIAMVVFIAGTPSVLITFEFSRDVRLFSLFIAFYLGLSFLAPTILIFTKISPRKKYDHGEPTKKQVTIQINKSPRGIGLAVFTALGVGVFSYFIVINVAAAFFHMSAPKEMIEIKAKMTSAWPARKDIRKDCQYHLLFDTPKISPAIQSICLSKEQWPYYRDLDFSEENMIILYGNKSYFGYELTCCK